MNGTAMPTDDALDAWSRALVDRIENLCLTLDRAEGVIADTTYATRRWQLGARRPLEPQNPMPEPREMQTGVRIPDAAMWRAGACYGSYDLRPYGTRAEQEQFQRQVCGGCAIETGCTLFAETIGETRGVWGEMFGVGNAASTT